MKRYKISVLFDGLFTGFAVFVTLLIIFSSLAGRTLSLILSSVSGFSFFLLTVYLLNRRYDKKTVLLSEQPEKQNLMFYLCLNSSDKTFIKLFETFNKTLIKTPKGLYLKENDVFILPLFSFDGLKKSRIADAYKRVNGKALYVLSNDITPEIRSFCSVLDNKIMLFGSDEVYLMFKKAKLLPKSNNVPQKNTVKSVFKAVAKRVFVRKHRLKYFLFGITFLFFSFLVPFKFYYVIFGTILMLLSLACVFTAKPQKEKPFWEN